MSQNPAESIPSDYRMNCHDKYDGEMWNKGFYDMVPCRSSQIQSIHQFVKK